MAEALRRQVRAEELTHRLRARTAGRARLRPSRRRGTSLGSAGRSAHGWPSSADDQMPPIERAARAPYLRIEQPDQAVRRLHRAATTSRSRSSSASSSASSGRRAAARPRCCARSPGSTSRRSGRIEQAGQRHLRPAARGARLRHRLPVLRAVPQPHGRQEHRLRAREPARRARRGRRGGSRSCSRWSASRTRATSIRPSSRAASSSGSRSPARWRPRPACCCSTSRSRRSTPRSGRICATRSRQLQRRLGVTTIMVTHDQEEALTMADRIVVMNHGVIDQVGTPLEIYREPATPLRRRLHRHDELPARPGRRPGPGRHRRDRGQPARAARRPRARHAGDARGAARGPAGAGGAVASGRTPSRHGSRASSSWARSCAPIWPSKACPGSTAAPTSRST